MNHSWIIHNSPSPCLHTNLYRILPGRFRGSRSSSVTAYQKTFSTKSCNWRRLTPCGKTPWPTTRPCRAACSTGGCPTSWGKVINRMDNERNGWSVNQIWMTSAFCFQGRSGTGRTTWVRRKTLRLKSITWNPCPTVRSHSVLWFKDRNNGNNVGMGSSLKLILKKEKAF